VASCPWPRRERLCQAGLRQRNHGDICLTHRAELAAPVPPVATPTAAGRAVGVVGCRLACGPIFQSKAAIFRSNSGLNGKAGQALIRNFRSKTERDSILSIPVARDKLYNPIRRMKTN
jgi:hypothetical protein